MDPKSPELRQRLSGTDAAFLYLERKEIPLHIACVFVFEEPIPFDEFLATIDSKLHLLPRYREVPVSPPFGIGYPNWEYDPHFDIRRHIIRVTVNAPGGEAELEDLASRIFSVVMSRDKPLWELYVIEGLQGGRGALIAKLHHSLADGVAGASLLRIMFDPTAKLSHAIHKPHFQPPAPPREPSLTDAIASAIHSSLENLVAAEAGLVDLAHGLLSDRTQQGLQGLTALLPEIARPVQRLPFNRPCGAERKFCWAEFDFADLKAIRTAMGGTVNDVIATVVTRAVAKYTKLHGESISGRLLRMVCPVSIRRDEQSESLGNQISFLPVTLPMDIEDPVQHLKAVARRIDVMKNARAADLLAIAGSWLGAAPPPAQALFWWGIPLVPLPAPLLNLICTNIPGSPTPLYTVGKRMLSSYPQVPTGYELGVGIAVQSYDGKMSFGLNADAVVCADVNRLRDFIRISWAEIAKAAGIQPAPQRAAAERKQPAPKKKAAKAARVAVPESVIVQSPRRPPAASKKPEPVKPAAKSKPAEPARAAVPKTVAPAASSEPAPVKPAAADAAAKGQRAVASSAPARQARAEGPKPVAPAAPSEPEPLKEPKPTAADSAKGQRPVVKSGPTKQVRARVPKPVTPAAPSELEPAKPAAAAPSAAERQMPTAKSRPGKPARAPVPEPVAPPAPGELVKEPRPAAKTTAAPSVAEQPQPGASGAPEPAKEPAPAEETPLVAEPAPPVDHANRA